MTYNDRRGATDENGRIKLTWAQTAWGISFIIAILSAWFDLRTQSAENGRQITALRLQLAERYYTREQIDLLRAARDLEIDRLRRNSGR